MGFGKGMFRVINDLDKSGFAFDDMDKADF